MAFILAVVVAATLRWRYRTSTATTCYTYRSIFFTSKDFKDCPYAVY